MGYVEFEYLAFRLLSNRALVQVSIANIILIIFNKRKSINKYIIFTFKSGSEC